MMYEDILKLMPDVTMKQLRDCIVMDRFNNKENGKKVFRVVDYKRVFGKGGSPRPIIGLGNEPDVPPPVIKNARREAHRRYDAKFTQKGKEEKARAQAESVFSSMLAPTQPVEIKTVGKRVVKQH
jgi:hypothetical protein